MFRLLGSVLVFISFFANSQNINYEIGFKQRSNVIIQKLAIDYQPPNIKYVPDPGKYFFPKAIARYYLFGNQDSLANSIITSLQNEGVFHFTAIGLARLYTLFPQFDQLKNHCLILIT